MSSNLDRFKAGIERRRHLFDLDRNDLGRKLCKAMTDGVQACISGQHALDGTRWADLSQAYEEWKSVHHPGNPMAVLHGTMADPREVAGEVEVSTDRATVTFGSSEQAREEAAWFQEGNARQPARPFWGFTADSLKEVEAILNARFAKP